MRNNMDLFMVNRGVLWFNTILPPNRIKLTIDGVNARHTWMSRIRWAETLTGEIYLSQVYIDGIVDKGNLISEEGFFISRIGDNQEKKRVISAMDIESNSLEKTFHIKLIFE